jgi:hypothetical protein
LSEASNCHLPLEIFWNQRLAMPRILAVFLLFALSLPAFQYARAQSMIEVIDLGVSYHFGEQVNIQARIDAPAPITDASILFRAQGESSTRIDHVSIEQDGRINYRYTFAQGPLRSFARIDFWFHATLETGEQVDSPHYYFYYADDRFPWRTLEDSGIRVHWYAGDEAFAHQALDTARAGLQKTGTMLSVSPDHPLDIYIYAVAADLQTALEIGGQSWVGGHASPDLGVSVVAIAPGQNQSVEIERKIPHELAHLLTYEVVGQRYDALPVWLREGIASMAESPNPDYPRAISLAVEQRSLIPIAELCGSFPPEMSRIQLAYAESESFTRFLVTKYGNSGLVNLIHAYADGLDCEQGPVRALGNPLSKLESEWWRNAPAGINNGTALFENLLPYLAILAVTLIVPLAFVAAVWRTPYGREQLEEK